MNRTLYWLPAVAWMGVIFYFSGLTDPTPMIEPSPFKEYLGRALHAGEYAVLTFWYVFGWTEGRLFQSNLPTNILLYSAVMAVAYGLTDEMHQIFVPGRSFQILDLFLDAGGAVLGVIVIGKLGGRSGASRGGDLEKG